MMPTIAEGSRLRVELTDRVPRVGEVWLFVAGSDDVIGHRFVRRERGGRLIFIGDTAPRADPPVTRDRLVGRVAELELDGVKRRVTRRSGWRPMLCYVTGGVRRRLPRRPGRGAGRQDPPIDTGLAR